MERPRHARPLRTSVNTLFILLLGAAIGYSAYPILNALRSDTPSGETSRTRSTATPAILEGEEPLDAVIWPGRHLMIGVAGTELDDETRAMLAHVRPGAVILHAENLDTREQVLALVDDIKRSAGLGTDDTSLPLIAADLRGIDAQGLGVQAAPVVATLASIGSVDTARKLGRSYAAEYAQLGFAMVFSPILDVYDPELFAQRPDTYDQDNAEATKMALAFLGGAREGGVIPIGAGFPGRGAARSTGSNTVPVLDQDRYQLAKIMFSFIEAVSGDEKIPAVVVEHVAVPALDDDMRPASLSPVLVDIVLREKCGYEGVVIASDIMGDPALAAEPTERVAVQALVAGCDAVIMADPDPRAILDVCKSIQTAVFLYTLPSNQLAASKARLDSLQNWLRASDRIGRGEEPAQVAQAPAPPAMPTLPPVEDEAPPAAPPTIAISKEDAPEEEPAPEDVADETSEPPADEETPPTTEEAPSEDVTPDEGEATEDAAEPPAPEPPLEHTVTENESLAAIANQYGITVKNLLTWNDLIDPQVEPGQVLRVAAPEEPESEAEPEVVADDAEAEDEAAAQPDEAEDDTQETAAEPPADTESTTTYTVAPGDTLYRIAEKHNTTTEHLIELNNLDNANVVVLGAKLKVPAP